MGALYIWTLLFLMRQKAFYFNLVRGLKSTALPKPISPTNFTKSGTAQTV